MAFLTLGTGLATIVIPVPRTGGATERPDGIGKRRWEITTAALTPATYTALRALVGTPRGPEGDRAWDGTLLTDLAPVAVGGVFATTEGVTLAEVRLTDAPITAKLTGDTACYARRVTLVLREP